MKSWVFFLVDMAYRTGRNRLRSSPGVVLFGRPASHRCAVASAEARRPSAAGSIKPGGGMPKKDKRRVFRSRLALRDMRLRAGLTEQALAAQLGVTYHTIQAWEKGE